MSSPNNIVTFDTPIWLASRSPRRRQLLEEAGIQVQVMPPEVDDAVLKLEVSAPEQSAIRAAEFKAQQVFDQLGKGDGTILAADTICVMNNEIFGQPRDQDDARRMLNAFANAEHQTMTGVCLISRGSATVTTFFDSAKVTLGEVSDDEIEQYLSSNQWQGKAGAYNISERIEVGWPIKCDGDPTTVMGLPMGRLLPMLTKQP